MAKRRDQIQHEILTPEIVQRLREATQKNYDAWWTENFGHLDLTAWDRYSAWLRKELAKYEQI